ncbi:Ribose-5-phosphate isomerase B [Austwickia sp. TVS 96-490-7B]|uniref:ribose 5-phosphate isomerase B n=1 Tax=Austwickia sp. TVS 96-490-7B TaxID=2830843 RepID=UPI001C59B928|nr:ribose 5-phosphate isomerase B [Austwickia sp. TVS 96-490-7B]MBW3086673.1 Ribose-5-phosphate isomerase B [Austwickia sp. TVS 96-490-7B]
MRIVVGSDHGAHELKNVVKAHLQQGGHEVVDVGSDSAERVDYPIYGHRAARQVADGHCDLGIVMCGTGIGIGLAANAVPGVRCAIVSEAYSARLARQHNDANMLALGGRVVAPEYATMIVDEFVTASFEGGRHAQRVDMIPDPDLI